MEIRLPDQQIIHMDDRKDISVQCNKTVYSYNSNTAVAQTVATSHHLTPIRNQVIFYNVSYVILWWRITTAANLIRGPKPWRLHILTDTGHGYWYFRGFSKTLQESS
jgi:hypothetical protein